MKYDQQYIRNGLRIVRDGDWIENKRTGKRCLTAIGDMVEIDVGAGIVPMLTIKRTFWKMAIAEMIGYLQGLNNAEDFRKLGTTTWDANANKTPAWLDNPHRKGEDDMGMVYGAVARNWPKHDGTVIDTVKKVYENLRNGIDDRDEIISFRNPGMFELGCLRPCMFEHIFSLVNGTLHMSSTSRSIDEPLGAPFNSIQGFFLLTLMARITGNVPGIWRWNKINCHVYEDQLPTFIELLGNESVECEPRMIISDRIQTLDDVMTMTVDDVQIVGYPSADIPRVDFPFSE